MCTRSQFRSNRTRMHRGSRFNLRRSCPVSSKQKIQRHPQVSSREENTPAQFPYCFFNLNYPLLHCAVQSAQDPGVFFEQMCGHLIYLYSQWSHFVSLFILEIHHFASANRNIIFQSLCLVASLSF